MTNYKEVKKIKTGGNTITYLKIIPPKKDKPNFISLTKEEIKKL